MSLNQPILKLRRCQRYDSGTIAMCRLRLANTFRCILAKLGKKMTTSCVQKDDDSLHMQSRWHFTLHSYTSNSRNTQWSQSVPPITVSLYPCSYVTSLSLIIFKIIPHPMTLLTAFPLKVIILYLFLYHLFSLAYCRITYPLSSSHISRFFPHLHHIV
jgi:hypothetical protein